MLIHSSSSKVVLHTQVVLGISEKLLAEVVTLLLGDIFYDTDIDQINRQIIVKMQQ